MSYWAGNRLFYRCGKNLSVTAIEAQSQFNQLLERVVKGEEVIITQRQIAVARLVPEGRVNLDTARKAVARLDKLRKGIAARPSPQAKLTVADFKSAVEEGRR